MCEQQCIQGEEENNTIVHLQSCMSCFGFFCMGISGKVSDNVIMEDQTCDILCMCIYLEALFFYFFPRMCQRLGWSNLLAHSCFWGSG